MLSDSATEFPMKDDLEARLVEFASSLEEADRYVMQGLRESDWDLFLVYLRKFNDAKKQIKSILMEFPAITIHNPAARDVIRQVSLDEPFPADKIASKIASLCEGGTIEHRDVCALPEEEVDGLADLLYSSYNHKEYVKNLYEIGCLILGIPVPRALLAFVSAARDSYAFQNYLAVLSLCRTMLEIALRDMAERKGLIERNSQDPGLLSAQIRRKIAPPHLRDSVEGLYRKTSLLIHGRTFTDRNEARDVFRTTLEIIQSTYKHYGLG